MAPRGRPRKEVDLQKAVELLNARYKLQEVAESLNVSTDVLRRRLKEAGTGFRDHLTDEELTQAIRDNCEPEGHGRMSGCRIVQAGLSVHAGIRAPRDQVLRVQHALDPEAHAARQERVLHRQLYDTDEAMVAWHIDSYEKLKPYGFIIHGCVDGGSNYVTYMIVATDKTAATITGAYMTAVERFGRPQRVRADMAFEALGVGQDILDHRGPGAYITGPSTSNTKIENWWNFAWSHWGQHFKNKFMHLEREGWLDRGVPADIEALQYCFINELQRTLTDQCDAWNFHPVRPQAAYGISTYVPAHRFLAAVGGPVAALKMLRTEAVAPALTERSGLTAQEQVVHAHVFGIVVQGARDNTERYIWHRLVAREIRALRLALAQPGFAWHAFCQAAATVDAARVRASIMHQYAH